MLHYYYSLKIYISIIPIKQNDYSQKNPSLKMNQVGSLSKKYNPIIN